MTDWVGADLDFWTEPVDKKRKRVVMGEIYIFAEE